MAQKAVYATGRRKTASARVFLTPNTSEKSTIVVNNRTLEEYFPRKTSQMLIMQPLQASDRANTYNYKITVAGGGNAGQAGAVVHGIARALKNVEPDLKKALRDGGFLTRDSRIVERKKPGRHKARKRPQYSKR